MVARGQGDTFLKSPEMFSGAWTTDIRATANHIKRKFPVAPLMAVGFSLGANILVKYLGEEEESTPFVAACSVANPFDFVKADKRMQENSSSVFYSKRLVGGLRRYLNRNMEQFLKMPEVNIKHALESKNIHEFDNRVVIKACGYASNQEYYVDASSSRYIHKVKIPLLAMNAVDDPVSPLDGVPVESCKKNPNLIFVLTSCGGHLAWLEGWKFWSTSWSDRACIDFLSTVLESKKDQ